jgi:uncharacterized membrane protein
LWKIDDGGRPVTGYLVLRFLHIIGSAVLLGTGAGIAFFMLMAHLSRDTTLIAGTARIVVIADFVFTATAVVLQPVTGALLASMAGYPILDGWIGLSIILYFVTGAFWLPVVWIQMRMRDLATAALHRGAPLPRAYYRYFRIWFAFGFPAFASVLGIFWLMTAKPTMPLW